MKENLLAFLRKAQTGAGGEEGRKALPKSQRWVECRCRWGAKWQSERNGERPKGGESTKSAVVGTSRSPCGGYGGLCQFDWTNL